MQTSVAGVPYTVPPEPSRLPASLLAVGVHALLLLFLWTGIQWQNSRPVAVEAEVWDLKTQFAAPPPVEAPPPDTAPPQETAKPTETPPPVVPDIKLEREKLKAQQKKALEDKRLAEKKAAEEKKAKELADKKAAAEKLAKSKPSPAEQKALAKLREEEMKRILGTAGNGTTGDAAKSTAPRFDAGYMAQLVAKIKSNIIYSGNLDVPGAPKAIYRIEQLPTGEIISVKKIKSSGIPAYDSAVENAINKSSPLPKKKDGSVERSIEAEFDLKDKG